MFRTFGPLLAWVLMAAVWANPASAQQNCEGVPAHVFFQAEPRGSSCESFDGAVGEVEVPIPAGSPSRRHTVAVAIMSELGSCHPGLCREPDLGESRCGSGAQGWLLSIALEGDLVLVDANIEEANPFILCGGAIVSLEIVDPDRPGPDGLPQGQGVICLVQFLCGVNKTVLNPGGTETVLGITLEAARPAGGGSVSGTLRCRDGLAAAGAPASNLVTVRGDVGPFCDCRQVAVRFTAEERVPFRRCDANDDGDLALSDPLAVLGWLFLGGAAPACRPAADCNADRTVNVADAVYALLHLFHGGSPPPAPYPECGFSEHPLELCEGEPQTCPS